MWRWGVYRLSCAMVMAANRPAGPTFYKHVAPILQAHCAQCHRPGEVEVSFTATRAT